MKSRIKTIQVNFQVLATLACQVYVLRYPKRRLLIQQFLTSRKVLIKTLMDELQPVSLEKKNLIFSKNQELFHFPVVLHFQKVFVIRHVSQRNNFEFYSTYEICWQKCWCGKFRRLFRKESNLIIETYQKNTQLLADSIYRFLVAGHLTQQFKHFFPFVVL